MKDQLRKVQEFHQVFGCYLAAHPYGAIPPEQTAVRAALMQEELDEYRQACAEGDLVGVADALTDLMYVVLGSLLAHGLQNEAEALFDEVHRSNMSKLDENGQPIYRADGKVLKSTRYSPPDLKSILQA